MHDSRYVSIFSLLFGQKDSGTHWFMRCAMLPLGWSTRKPKLVMDLGGKDGLFSVFSILWNRTNRCRQRCPSLPPVGRCHAYEIEKKYIYECNGCGQRHFLNLWIDLIFRIGRHSKSFNTEKFICGKCKGRFVLTRNGKPVSEASQPKLNRFALFVKENYQTHMKNGMQHSEVRFFVPDDICSGDENTLWQVSRV